MSIEQIIAELDDQIARLTEARRLLSGNEVNGTKTSVSGEAPKKSGRPKGRIMSAAGRKRISEMMKARWAARRKQAAKK